MKKKKPVSKANTVVVSFKVSPEMYKALEKYAATQKDETGITLSPSLAARRLMLEAWKKN